MDSAPAADGQPCRRGRVASAAATMARLVTSDPLSIRVIRIETRVTVPPRRSSRRRPPMLALSHDEARARRPPHRSIPQSARRRRTSSGQIKTEKNARFSRNDASTARPSPRPTTVPPIGDGAGPEISHPSHLICGEGFYRGRSGSPVQRVPQDISWRATFDLARPSRSTRHGHPGVRILSVLPS